MKPMSIRATASILATPEGQRLLQEKKMRLEEEAGGVPREDSSVASLADRVDEDLVVAEASSVGGEEST